MNSQLEVTWRTLCTIVHSIMIHVQVLEAYIHFALMYAADNIFPVLPIKYLINEDSKPTAPCKLVTGTKPSISHLCVLFCSCFVKKSTAHIGKKVLNMRHQAQKDFCGIFVGIPQHQKGCLVYVPHKHNIISSYDVIFYESISITLAYTSQPYLEAIYMLPSVSYITYDTSSKEQTGSIIMFAQFERGDLLSETHNDMESGNESDDN